MPTPLVGNGRTVVFPPGNGGDAVPEDEGKIPETETEDTRRLVEPVPRIEPVGAVPVPKILLELPRGNGVEEDANEGCGAEALELPRVDKDPEMLETVSTV